VELPLLLDEGGVCVIRALQISAFVLLTPLAVHAQSAQKATVAKYVVEGRVTDWVDGSAIVAATVVAIDSHKNSYSTISVTDGKYRLEHLPRESTLTLTCSQLGYNPNPTKGIVKFRGGLATWNTRLFKDSGDAAYLKAAAAQLSSLNGSARISEAKFVADNADAESRKTIGMEIQNKMSNGGDSSLAEVAAVFNYGTSEADQIREKLRVQLDAVLATDESSRGLIANISDVQFDTGKYTSKPAAQVSLTKVANILQQYPGLKVMVEDQADSIGGDEYNKKLSENRAIAVHDFLLANGVPAANVTTVEYDKSSPIVDNQTAAGRQQGRRVALVVSGDVIGTQPDKPE
jgi:outer membrane protein OmpA-like peptidoglycan-associated protein